MTLLSTSTLTSTSSVQPDVRFLLLPMPQFNLLPFGGFLDKLRFSADEEDHSRQKYCQWTIVGEKAGPLLSSSGVTIEVPMGLGHARYRLAATGTRHRSARGCHAGSDTTG